MNTANTSEGSSKTSNGKFVNIAIGTIIFVAAIYALVSQYKTTVKASDGIPRDEIALDVALRAYSAISAELGAEDKTQVIDCNGSDTNQVICKATGNVLHILKFETVRAMPNFKLHALRRGNDGKFLELDLTGVSEKLQSHEVDELLQIFKKPIK